MRLYEYLYLMPDGEELTVWDKDYDTESYFYSGKPESDDEWSKAMLDLSKLLTITEIRSNGVVVNLSDVIEKHIDKIAEHELFYKNYIESIMDGIDNILSGNVSESWMQEFVSVLKSK